jgi:hypothetical protein
MGDVEDPELYAAEPIIAFEKTEQGKWLHANSTRQLEFIVRPNQESYGWLVIIFAWLTEQDIKYYQLKWGNQNGL